MYIRFLYPCYPMPCYTILTHIKTFLKSRCWKRRSHFSWKFNKMQYAKELLFDLLQYLINEWIVLNNSVVLFNFKTLNFELWMWIFIRKHTWLLKMIVSSYYTLKLLILENYPNSALSFALSVSKFNSSIRIQKSRIYRKNNQPMAGQPSALGFCSNRII